MTEAEEFLSLQEVAERLKVSEQAVRRWIKSGRLKAYQPVREYRIRVSDLDAFLEARATPKVPAPPSPDELTFNHLLEEERRSLALNVYRASMLTPIKILADYWEQEAAKGIISFDRAEDMATEYNAMFFAKVEAEHQLRGIPHDEFHQVDREVSQAMRRFYGITEEIIEKTKASKDDLQKLRDKRDRASAQAHEEGGSSEATA